MKTSQRGIDLIKSFEGYSAKPVKLVGEAHYTWGYGHYGVDVPPTGYISQADAEKLLQKDLLTFERHVERVVTEAMTQNQFDALVSFTYNCGVGNLEKLMQPPRKLSDVPNHILYYTNSGGGDLYKAGLLRRRKAELALFLDPDVEPQTPEPQPEETEEKTVKDVTVKVGTEEVPAKLIGGVTYVPLRQIIAALADHIRVEWTAEDGATVKID